MILISSPAKAGYFRDWCEKYIVMQDPYEYETSSHDFVCRKIAALEIRERWDTLTGDEVLDLKILRRELERRRVHAELFGQAPPPPCP